MVLRKIAKIRMKNIIIQQTHPMDNAQVVSCPRITVAMPVFNGGEYLKDAVLSIIWQTYTDFELITINDGSNDVAIPVY